MTTEKRWLVTMGDGQMIGVKAPTEWRALEIAVGILGYDTRLESVAKIINAATIEEKTR
jgi:hypothetical protein